MDNSAKKFLGSSFLLIFIFVVIILVFSYLYYHSTINTYNSILLVLLFLTITLAAFFLMSILIIFHAYRKKRVSPIFLLPVKIGLKLLLPLIMFISGLLKSNRDTVRSFYVNINNILVRSGRYRYPVKQVLILLPHCLQNTDCGYKITNDINNCKRCGKCCIKDIADIVDKFGAQARVVTGGTAARKLVREFKPGIIVSVACERDLVSGIADVGSIPVLGFVNERPNGPCCNTVIDVEAFERMLEEVILQN